MDNKTLTKEQELLALELMGEGWSTEDIKIHFDSQNTTNKL